jgi:seryl-tRNA(Sec) selenium transferase
LTHVHHNGADVVALSTQSLSGGLSSGLVTVGNENMVAKPCQSLCNGFAYAHGTTGDHGHPWGS